MNYHFNETPDEKRKRLDREAFWAWTFIWFLIAATVIGGGFAIFAAFARGVVWIRWAFG